MRVYAKKGGGDAKNRVSMLSLIRTFKDFKEKIRKNSRTLPKLSCTKREEIEPGNT